MTPIIITILAIAAASGIAFFYGRKTGNGSRLRIAIDSLPTPLAIITADYRLMHVNTAYFACIGKTRQPTNTQKCYIVLYQKSAPCEFCKMHEAIAQNRRMCASSAGGNLCFHPVHSATNRFNGVIEEIQSGTNLEGAYTDLEERSRVLADATAQLKKAREDMDEELDLARQVQQSIMPQNPPPFDGLRMALTYHPIEAVGGDLYDFIPFSKEKMGIFIGDASGHGLASSLVSTISKMSLYNYSKTETPADRLLENLNNDLRGNIRSSSTTHYLTCFWGIFDAHDNSLTYARAGHPMPIVVRANGEVRLLDATGAFAGILESPYYEQKKFFFRKGDRCYLCTDGIFEVMVNTSAAQQILGFKKFVDIVAQVNKRPFEEIVPALRNRLAAYTYEDDYTLLVFEVTRDAPARLEERLPGFSIDDDISFIRFSQYEEADRYFSLFFRKLSQNGYAADEKVRIKLCLEELVANALKHGNRFAPNKSVTVAYSVSESEVKISVVDEGEGFDLHTAPDPTQEQNMRKEGGRGVYLIKHFADSVGQNSRGNGVYMVKSRKQDA